MLRLRGSGIRRRSTILRSYGADVFLFISFVTCLACTARMNSWCCVCRREHFAFVVPAPALAVLPCSQDNSPIGCTAGIIYEFRGRLVLVEVRTTILLGCSFSWSVSFLRCYHRCESLARFRDALFQLKVGGCPTRSSDGDGRTQPGCGCHTETRKVTACAVISLRIVPALSSSPAENTTGVTE